VECKVSESAGKSSPHLDQEQQKQAAQHAAPQALVIHEVVREEGEAELDRRSSAVAWSGLAAGLSMGFSFMGLAFMRGLLPDAPWAQLIYAAGYTIGFVITILGRQELFTESTLTAVLPLLVRRDAATFLSLLRFWLIVLVANLCGTALFAALVSVHGLFPEGVTHAMQRVGQAVVNEEFLPDLLKSILSGWLIALMAWVLPSAKSARLFVVMLFTYIVALGGLPHVVAGSVEAAYAVITQLASWQDYLLHFLLPTLLGNTIGGVALVALLNHAPLSPELQGEQSGGASSSRSSNGSKSSASPAKGGPPGAAQTQRRAAPQKRAGRGPAAK
jgi:formate/nitrite transporter FocA (FNT family)